MKKWWVILLLVASFAFTTNVSANFKDVPANAEYKEAIKWAVEKGIISGYQDGTFKPMNNVTEPQFLKMYIRLLNFKGEKDDSIPNFKAYYQIANVYQLPALKSSYDNVENKAATRGQVANLIAYAKGVGGHDVNNDSAYMMAQGYSKGQNSQGKTAAAKFGANNTLKRYHAVVFLYNAFKQDQQVRASYDPYKEDVTLTGPSVWPNKKYYVNDDTYFKIVSKGYADFEMERWHKGKLIGGYLTGKGNTRFGITVGDSYETFIAKNPLSSDQYSNKEYGNESFRRDEGYIIANLDTHQNYFVRGITWYTNDEFETVDVWLKDAQKDWTQTRYTDLELLFVEVANAHRYMEGLPAMQYASLVAKASFNHSVDLLKHNLTGHIGSDGSSFGERVERVKPKNFIETSEIVAYQQFPYDTVHAFLDSKKGHRDAILGDYTIMAPGIGVKVENGDFARAITTVVLGSSYKRY